jgi:hypothetical protein
VIGYRAMLDVPREFVRHRAQLLAAQRRLFGTRPAMSPPASRYTTTRKRLRSSPPFSPARRAHPLLSALKEATAWWSQQSSCSQSVV